MTITNQNNNAEINLHTACCSDELGTPSYYQLKNSDGIGFAVNQISKACLTSLLKSPDSPFHAKDSQFIKEGRTAQVSYCKIQSDDQTFQIAYKRICRKNFVKAVTGLFQKNRAISAFQAGQFFIKKGIPTPQPLLAMIPKQFSWKQKGYLAVEWLDHSQQFDQLCQDLSKLAINKRKQQLKQLSCQLGQVIGKMHAENISHHDLKAANILVKRTSEELKCFLIDLDGVEFPNKIKAKTRFKNIARLNTTSMKQKVISLTDKCRFLKSYCSLQPERHSDWKLIWKNITEQS